ncbi:MAG: adenylate/guanylate cyclase domain-containing protein [Saprospirales bacterium]|nr:adenylate/guanylate cyclase domain-containing protein [Saprospirales bacterium]
MKRQLAAVMFTDIVGYTSLMQRNEKEASAMRTKHRKVFNSLHEKYHGNLLQYFGDGTLSVFTSGVEAVRCAIEIQQAMNRGLVVPIRVGIHIGDIVFDDTEIFGDGVNVASRIESQGMAGSVFISGKLNDELKNHPEIETKSLGYYKLKNVTSPLEIFAITSHDLASPELDAMSGKRLRSKNAIAVLPFKNQSGDADNEYLCDGITEVIINALARIKELKVTSRTSSFFYKDTNLPLSKIGEELGVAIILEGSVRISKNRMRVSVTLNDVKEDFQFWSESLDRSPDDIFEVEDEVSILIADRLREHIGHFDVEEKLIATPDVSVGAYKSYLKGRYHLLKMNQQDIRTGMDVLKKTLESDPDFAEANLGMHLGYTLLGTLGFMPAMEAFQAGYPYLQKAIETNPELPECQLQMSYIRFLAEWDLKASYEHLQRAFEKRPTVDYYQSMASILSAEGNSKAALNYINTALQLDPHSNINFHLTGFIHYIEEDYDEAIRWFKKNKAVQDRFIVSALYWGQALVAQGKFKEALQLYASLKDPIARVGGMAVAYTGLGRKEDAATLEEELAKALDTASEERAMLFMIILKTFRGQIGEALDIVRKAFEKRLVMLVYLNVDPLLKPLQKDEEFKSLMSQIFRTETPQNVTRRKYQQPLFDHAELKEKVSIAKKIMEEEKPFLNPDLSLRDFSALLNLPVNYTSQLLNEGMDMNFSEFVNTYRLEHFKSLLADGSKAHLTLLALAYESGFNSKSVFNTFFKKRMGMTPRAYQKTLTN